MSKITSFSIGNFRAFGPTQTFPIKPITLVYGQNSAGKSSILDAVLFASHLARNGSPSGGDETFLHTNFDFTVTGNRVRLGTPQDFFHGKDPSNPQGMLLGAEVSGENFTVRTEVGFTGFDGIDEFRLFEPPLKLLYQLGSKKNNSGKMIDRFDRPQIANLELQSEHPVVGESISDAFKLLRGKLEEFCAENPGTPATKIIKNRLLAKNFASDENKQVILQQLVAQFSSPGVSLAQFPPQAELSPFRHLESTEDERNTSAIRIFAPHPTTELRFKPTLLNYIEAEVNRVLVEFALQPLEVNRHSNERAVHDALTSVAYCGALRETLELNAMFPRSMMGWKAKKSWDDTRRSLGGWTLSKKSVRFLNKWLAEHKDREAWYKLSVNEVRRKDDWSPSGVHVRLFDMKRKLSVGLNEVGSGIGQLIPVLLTAAGYERSLVCIKQPELHLHPALQADVGDVFVRHAKKEGNSDGNSFLIETHSEHLLLRIMRRIRETRKGTAKEGLALKADDVAVLYVENKGGDSIVREMPLSEDGELVRDWPGGFFEEGLREVLF